MKVIKEDYSNLSRIIFSIWLSNQNRYLSIKKLRAKANNELNELSNIEIKEYVNSNMNTPEFYNLRSSGEDISCSIESYKNLCRDQNRVILTAGVPHSTTYHEIDVKDLNNYLNNLKLLPLEDNQYHVFGSNPINVEFKGCGVGGFESILYPLQIGKKIAYLANPNKHGLQDSGLDFSKVNIWNLDYFNDVKNKYEEIYKDQSWLGFGFYQESINKESKLKEDIQNLDRVKNLQPVENPVMADAQQDSKEKAKEAKKLTDPMELKNQKAFLGANKQPVPKDAKIAKEATNKMYSLDESLFEDVIEEEAFTDRAAYCFDFAKEYITDNLLIDGVESNLALVLASKDPDYDPEWCSDDVYGNRLERDRNNYVRSLLNDLFANAPVEENESLKEDLNNTEYSNFASDIFNAVADVMFKYRDNEVSKNDVKNAFNQFISRFFDYWRDDDFDESLKEDISIGNDDDIWDLVESGFVDEDMIIDFLSDHETAFTDICNFFDIEEEDFDEQCEALHAEEVSDLVNWISCHDQLWLDFCNYVYMNRDKMMGEDDFLSEAKTNHKPMSYEEAKKFMASKGLNLPKDIYNMILQFNDYDSDMEMPNNESLKEAIDEDKALDKAIEYLVDHPYPANYDPEDIADEICANVFNCDYYNCNGLISHAAFVAATLYLDELNSNTDESLKEEFGDEENKLSNLSSKELLDWARNEKLFALGSADPEEANQHEAFADHLRQLAKEKMDKSLGEASYGNKGNSAWRSKSNKASKEDKEFENSLFARVDNELRAYGKHYEMPNQGHRYTNTGIGRDGIEIYGASEEDFDFAKQVANHFGLDFRIYKTPGNAGTKTALTGVVIIPEEMYDEKPEETAARLGK